MKKILPLSTILIFFIFSLKAQSTNNKYDYHHPIPFNPEKYICHKATNKIEIDGKADEQDWAMAKWTKSFVDIEGNLKPLPIHDTKAKMLYDENNFYFYFELKEPHIWATLKNRDDIIYQDDDIEIFIDPNGDSHEYFEFEWNAYNTFWDLILLKPYRVDRKPKVLFEYNTKTKSAVHIQGTINDNSDIDDYWSIEIAIPWFALNYRASANVAPANGEQWRVNFSRVDWKMNLIENGYEKQKNDKGKPLPENNWVWSPTGKINMHMPEMWGYVQFSDQAPGSEEAFINKPDEEIKWALWNLYWQQLKYYEDHQSYSDDLNIFTIPNLKKGKFNPSIYISPHSFEITHLTNNKQKTWIINKEGKIFKTNKID